MAHGLVSGVDRMATTSLETIWHADDTAADGRLVQVQARDPESTLLEMSGIVWPHDADNDVERTLQITTIEGNAIDTHIATMSRSGRVLGVVTAGYETVSFKVLLTDLLLELARAGGVPETLGTFDAGRNMFSTLQIAESWRVPGDHSETKPFFSLLSNHTGAGGIRGSFTTIRVVCRNTSSMYSAEHDAMATDAAERARNAWFMLRHTMNVGDRIADAVDWVKDGRARAESEQALLARLAAKVIPPKDVDRFIEQYIALPDDPNAKRARTVRENQRDEFSTVLHDVADLGNHALTREGISAYGLLQAVTRFEDWVSPVRAKDQSVGTRRAFRAFLGEREAEKTTALAMIREIANV